MDASSPRRVYRSRKQRPCDACRRRKICCVREANSPACSLCTLRSTTCTYNSKPNIRRRQPQPQPPAESPSSTQSQASEPTAEEWTPLFIGFSSDQDPYILRHCHFTGDYFNRPDWKCKRMYGGTDIPMHFSEVPDSHLDTRHDGLPVVPAANYPRETMQNLLKTFFEVVHASYPLLDPGAFHGDPLHLARENPALIGIICRLAAPFYFTEPSPSSPITITSTSETEPPAKNQYSWPPWRTYLHQTLTAQSRSPRLSTLETALLFTNRPLETHRAPNLPGLWPQIGSMVGMAHELGLNVDPTGWPISESERKRRVRIWWGVYMADKWNALGGGRPSYVVEGEWDVPVPEVGDFEGDGGGVGGAVFVAMCRVTVILGELLGEFYSLRAMRGVGRDGRDTDAGFGRLEGYLKRIEEVVERDMGFMKEVDEHIRDPTGTLTLALSTLRIILYRAVLRRTNTHSTSDPADPRLISLRQEAQTLCTELISFIANLRVSHLRAFWWAPLSRTNFAIAGSFMVSMLLSSTDNEEIVFWTEKIARYRGLLEMHSVTFDVTKLAVKRLGLIASVIEGRAGVGDGGEGTGGEAVPPRPRSPEMGTELGMGMGMGMGIGSLSELFGGGEGLDLFVDFQSFEYGVL
ncbi:fungal-specific transcription factor domain-containing protein [Aspergillus karnatakaensis]|uniref:Zn(II)2Cys6 transcription factor n=1 Tax=Aspergillus karnatakaensis TaxID=1810916 RepID=UPI003CCDEE31